MKRVTVMRSGQQQKAPDGCRGLFLYGSEIPLSEVFVLRKGRGCRYDVGAFKADYRSLPLMPFIKSALEEEKARHEEMQRVLRKSYNRKYLNYVCVDAVGDILKPQYVSEHFKVILERNGLKKIRFHDLRHSCASLMLANDISMKEIQEWLGHSNISTTANIYAHVDSESKRESARIIDKVLSE